MLGHRVRAEGNAPGVHQAPTYPARHAAVSQLERLSDTARELGLGSAGNPRLWADANRAMLHPRYAISRELMEGKSNADSGEGTVWTLANGLETLLTVWWVRLKRTPVVSAPVFAILVTREAVSGEGFENQ